MHTFLIATMILFLQQAASVESPQRREIDLHVTMIGLDASVSVPDEIDDPGAFVAGLRGKPGVRWWERFQLSALDKGAAKFTSGSDQAMISGYTYGLNVGQSRGTASPMNPAAEGAAPPPHETEAFAIVDGGWKLIHHTLRPNGGPEFELFDFAKDPLNLKDVAASHPEEVQRLAKLVAGWRQMARAARFAPDAESTKGLSQEQLQRLRSLGYIR